MIILLCMHTNHCKLLKIYFVLPFCYLYVCIGVMLRNYRYDTHIIQYHMFSCCCTYLSKFILTLLPLLYTGYLAAPDVVTQSAALNALPAKAPLQSGISFDPNAIEAFIKSLHERG